ncbi:hypothetical protein DENIS_4853 [Desulfonema ishimotonii]|uniref:Uncharacterized protein n=1 Tax=Desulfonema ishimotonii TaxID=45657 RepID=A0A401G3Q8_9BACT|nr:hypothetical protein [Desulfonema ishimotonii]GBC63854.1 hypothetical protein DENIS_4853 [Desulfonema ishimotonii]
MKTYHAATFRKKLYRLIDAVSFNGKIRDLADMLNRTVERSDGTLTEPAGHPGGFCRAFHKRRMGIAESYIRVAQELNRSTWQKRLHALRTLRRLSFHAKTVNMPFNTARVQIEIMKEAVKNLHNRRRQMEMISDFSVASYGHEADIRRFLRELRRVEVPEAGKPLSALDMGWDAHVHDTLSEGRKTPGQLVLDAFVKGISCLTLAYYDIPHRDIVSEAMEAGKILGIDVSIAIEFSVGERHRRKHFMFLPPARGPAAFLEYFDHNGADLVRFREGLNENRERRRKVITRILDNFNRTHRIRLNKGYPGEDIFALGPIRMETLEKIIPHGQYSRNHLSELLYERLKPVLKRRVLALKTQYEVSRSLFAKGILSGWEMERIEEACRRARGQYTRLSPASVKSAYFSSKDIMDYDSAFGTEADILPELKAAGGVIVYNRPLEHGMAVAAETVIRNAPWLDRIELMNMRDSVDRDPAQIIRLCRFTELINSGDLSELEAFIRDGHGPDHMDDAVLREALERYHRQPLVPVAGSAATGWKPQAPGMGFIRESRIPAKSRKHFCQSHYRLPRPVSDLINAAGRRPEKESDIYCMGKSSRFKPNPVGDEAEFEPIGIGRTWQYLNPALKNIIRVLIGFIPAVWWFKTAERMENPFFYPMIWLGITFFRNVFVDLIAFSGARPGAWSVRDIGFENVSQSLFWTGFSVPILGAVKLGYDYWWPFGVTGPLFVWLKFFVICIANGLYISAHNKLRKFDNRVIRANFFRSVLAWPFSALFAPVGNMLMVPSIVQAKFWSDVVAAGIEGSGKFARKIVLRKRDLMEILPMLRSGNQDIRLTAMLDLLYIWAKRQRGATCLARILLGRDGFAAELKNRLRHRNSGDRAEKIQKGREYTDLMLRVFSPQEAQNRLSAFILGRYTDREALVLTDLVSRHLVPLSLWLKKLKKKSGPPVTHE